MALGILAGAGRAQETQSATRPGKTPEGAVDHILGPSPTARRQAVTWARENLAAVAPVLVQALSERRGYSIHFDGIRALGELKDPRLSATLVSLYQRPDFPWKPQAVEALADHAFPGAMGVFMSALASPATKSRAAACRGIVALGVREVEVKLSERLGDEEASVRLEAARSLMAFGDHSGVPTVIRDLSLDRRFADADPGSVARDGAAGFLKELGVAPELIPGTVATAAQMTAIVGFLKAKLGAPAEKFPDAIVPHDPDLPPSFRYGVEVRSCPEGDLFLRCDEGGAVVLGRDLLRRFEIDAKRLDPIRGILQNMDTGRGRRIVGPVTCDFERFAIRDETGWRTLVIGPGRRDGSFDALEAAVREILQELRGPERAQAQVRRVAPFGIGGGAASRAEAVPGAAPR